MSFNTYYWHGCRLEDSAFGKARLILASGNADGCIAAFMRLLRSGDVRAISIALDHYAYSEATSRTGSDFIFKSFVDEVQEKARELLRGAPITGGENGVEEGANYASALGALLNLADSTDMLLIAHALETIKTANVRFTGAMAARTAIEKSPTVESRLIDALTEIIFDELASAQEREAVISAVGASTDPRAVKVLIQAISLPDLKVQANSALMLADQGCALHRELITTVVRNWPDDAPYPANEVRDLF